MTDSIVAIFHNAVLMTAVTGWFVAQSLKALLYTLLNHEFRFERLFGSGGMPSSHASTMLSAVVASLLKYGPDSFQFAISVLLALIVIHDARGVRLEAGRQAEVLNKLMRHGDLKELFQNEAYLKELVGHTPFQVVIGSFIGIITGLIMCTYVF